MKGILLVSVPEAERIFSTEGDAIPLFQNIFTNNFITCVLTQKFVWQGGGYLEYFQQSGSARKSMEKHALTLNIF